MRSGRGTRDSYCRPCRRVYASRWGKTRAKRVRPRPEFRSDARLISEMLASARYRAKNKNREFSITAADIVIPDSCPILGVALDRRAPGRKGANPYTPSIDRIDNSKGYVTGNVWIISHRANTLKSTHTVEELRAIVAAMEKSVDIPPGSGTVTT